MTRFPEAKLRFAYGRHETFPVRHGWLQKGLSHIQNTGGFCTDLETADALGLGSRMVKSLAFWLEASGMAKAEDASVPNGAKGRGRRRQWIVTELGKAILRHDRHLEYPISWWFVHALLATREGCVWGWFFNGFQERHFTRDACLKVFLDHVSQQSLNPPSHAVAERDVACLLNAYAAPSAHVSTDPLDPEDASVCPLRDLSLVLRHVDINRFEKSRPLDDVPPEVFLACASNLAERSGSDSVAFADLMREPNGPARVFGIGSDRIEELAERAVEFHRDRGVQIILLASERHLVVPRISMSNWFEAHFARVVRAAA